MHYVDKKYGAKHPTCVAAAEFKLKRYTSLNILPSSQVIGGNLVKKASLSCTMDPSTFMAHEKKADDFILTMDQRPEEKDTTDMIEFRKIMAEFKASIPPPSQAQRVAFNQKMWGGLKKHGDIAKKHERDLLEAHQTMRIATTGKELLNTPGREAEGVAICYEVLERECPCFFSDALISSKRALRGDSPVSLLIPAAGHFLSIFNSEKQADSYNP